MTDNSVSQTIKKLDVSTIRKDFPILDQDIHENTPLIYLDNAASSQKPLQVINAMNEFYLHYNSNVHRGIHKLSATAEEAYEAARDKVVKFINAAKREEIIFTSGTTEAINLVAYSWGGQNIGEGDVIITTELEHHANMVPWQLLAQRTAAEVRYVPLQSNGTLDLDAYHSMLDASVKLVAFNHVSNMTGSIQPVKAMTQAAHEVGAIVLVDGAQSVPHMPIDVQDLGIDFYAFSGHKMLAPTGVGVLYGKEEHLLKMPPFLSGGDMIRKVSLDKTTFNDLPYKFEAGTPKIAEVIGLGIAIDYLLKLGMENVRMHEVEMTDYALKKMSQIENLNLIGPLDPEVRGGVATFTLNRIHPHDIAQILDSHGVAVRAGQHCAQPAHKCLGVQSTARASFYVYNTREEVDALVEAIGHVKQTFGVE